MPFLDLTQLVTPSVPVFPGDPAPKLKISADHASHGFRDYELKTTMHVGTHMDGPLHMIPGGKKLSEFPISHFIGRGVLVDARGQSRIHTPLLGRYDLRRGDIVLVMTGFSQFYVEKRYFDEYPEMTKEFAEVLIQTGVKILGLDSASPDRSPFQIHKLLLSHDVPILENLTNLEQLIGIPNFEINALPAKFDTDSAPTRVIARIEN